LETCGDQQQKGEYGKGGKEEGGRPAVERD